jgi:hypothetical protein
MFDKDCEATKKCHLQWGNLRELGHSKNRYCRHCDRGVRLCHTETEVELSAAIGRCVAYRPEQKVTWVGEKSATYISGDGSNIRVYLKPGQTLNDRQREEIRMLYRTKDEAFNILAAFDAGAKVLLFELSPDLAGQLVEDLRDDLGIEVEVE